MKYLIRREYSEKIGIWSEVIGHYKDREECFRDANSSCRDRRLTRIEVYELLDPEVWRNKDE